jgi:hypothetical protein
MKQIIALQGKVNCGKTQTLKEVIFALENQANTKYYLTRRNGIITKHDDFNDFRAYMSAKSRKDIAVIIELTINGTVIKVGISTYGDPVEATRVYLKGLVALECDIIFCGCRPAPNITVDWINDYEGYKVHFESQKIEKDAAKQGQSNKDVAQCLIKLAGLNIIP